MKIKKYKSIIHDNIVAKDIVMLVGCGISALYPTDLPLGKELTDYILTKSLGEDSFEFLIEKWNKLNNIIKNETNVNIPLMRLELILNCVNQVDEEFKIKNVLQGFYSFTKIKPNKNHFYLSNLFKEGAEIITANFDCAVENALGIDYTVVEDMGVDVTINQYGKIYHFHGIGGDDKRLGATISTIKSGFSKEFEIFLDNILREKILICVGYSFSDFLDMNVFLKKQENKKYRKVIFFQHGDDVDSDLITKLEKLFLNFKDVTILYGNTSEFLCDISHSRFIKVNDNKVVDWKSTFENIFCDSRNKMFYLLKIFNQCGINISDEMTWLGNNRKQIINKIITSVPEEIKSQKYVEDLQDRNKTILSDIVDIAKKSGYQGDDYNFINQIYTNLTAKSGVRFEAAHMDFKDILNYFDKNDFEKNNVADQYVYAYLRITKEKIVNYICDGCHNEELSDLQFLWEIGSKLVNFNVKKFTYISFYIDICRRFSFLSSVLKYCKIGDLERYEKKQIEMSMEICAMESVVMTYLNSALNILTYFLGEMDYDKLRYAKHKIDVAKNCSSLLNDVRIEVKAKNYENNINKLINIYEQEKCLNSSILLDFLE